MTRPTFTQGLRDGLYGNGYPSPSSLPPPAKRNRTHTAGQPRPRPDRAGFDKAAALGKAPKARHAWRAPAAPVTPAASATTRLQQGRDVPSPGPLARISGTAVGEHLRSCYLRSVCDDPSSMGHWIWRWSVDDALIVAGSTSPGALHSAGRCPVPVAAPATKSAVDAGLMMGRSFRAGWAASGAFVSAGALSLSLMKLDSTPSIMQ